MLTRFELVRHTAGQKVCAGIFHRFELHHAFLLQGDRCELVVQLSSNAEPNCIANAVLFHQIITLLQQLHSLCGLVYRGAMAEALLDLNISPSMMLFRNDLNRKNMP